MVLNESETLCQTLPKSRICIKSLNIQWSQYHDTHESQRYLYFDFKGCAPGNVIMMEHLLSDAKGMLIRMKLKLPVISN